MDIGDFPQGIVTESGGGVGFRRVEKAKQPVRGLGQHLWLRSGGAYFQPLIDQSGIDINDFQWQALNQLYRRTGFAGASRPHQKNHRRL